jgi:excisionase family DNA binding protein
MSDSTGIYAIENLLNGSVYIGATKASFTNRWHAHLFELHRRTHYNDGLRADVRQYGACSFRMVILQEIPDHIPMAPFEQFWIDYLRQVGLHCYNISPAYETVIPEHRTVDPIIRQSHPYTVAQLAAEVGISHGTVVQLIKEGFIEAIRNGPRWAITRSEYQRFPLYWNERCAMFDAQARERRLLAKVAEPQP